MSNPVSEREILESLHRVPDGRWHEVLEFMESLHITPAGKPAVQTGSDLAGSKLIGIWQDRTDMGDSRAFARQLRERAERRERADASGH